MPNPWAERAALLLCASLLAACGAPQDRGSSGAADGTDGPPSAVYALVLQAQLHTTDGEFDAAAEALDCAVRLAPADVDLRVRHAVALARTERDTDTIEACDHAELLGAAPWSVAPARASALARTDGAEAAARALRGADAPDAPSTYYLAWFDLARDIDEPRLAIDAGAAWVAREPDTPQAWRTLGIAQRDADDPASAAASLAQAAALPGALPWDSEQSIVLSVEANDPEGALDEATRCTTRFHESIACRALRAALRDEVDGHPDVVDAETIDAVAAISSGDRRTIFAAGRWLQQYGRAEVTAAYARRVAELRPHNIGALSASAWVASSAGLDDLAVELTQRVLDNDPTNFDALNFIGYRWAERGIRLDEAEVYVREALFLRPDNANIMDSLAWVLHRQGRHEEALAVQLEVVAMTPDNAVLQDHLGDIYFALGQFEEAIGAWEYALQVAGPGDEDVVDTVPQKVEQTRALLAS